MNINKKPFKTLIIGEVGQGKSTFINKILGEDVALEGDSKFAKGCTKEIIKYNGKIKGYNIDITLYDTPGFNDSEIDLGHYIDIYEEQFANQTLDCIIYVIKRTDYRFPRNHKLFLQIVQELFNNKNISSSFILLITHCDITGNIDENEYANDMINEMNKQLDWKITRYICFNKNQPDKSIFKFVDYLNSIDNELFLKDNIPATNISNLIENSLDHDELIKEKKKCPELDKPIEIDLNNTNKKIINLIALGDQSVGKSALIKKISDPNYDMTSSPATIGIDFINHKLTIDNQIVSVQIWDTAGQERMHSISHSQIKKCDGFFVVYSTTSRESFNNIDYWIEKIKANCSVSPVIYLIGSKIDDEMNRKVKKEEALNYSKGKKIKYEEISAKKLININEVVFSISRDILNSESYKKKIPVGFQVNDHQHISKINCFRRIITKVCGK